MPQPYFPTFRSWLTTFEVVPRKRWRIAPWWKADTWASQQRTLLRTLALAARERLPYGPLVAALANDHQWSYRWCLGRLAQRLQAGTPLADAVEQTRGVLSQEQTLAVRFGAESGTLPTVLTSLVEESSDTRETNSRLRQMGFYLAGLLGFTTLILMFLIIKIMPEFNKILEEFYLDPPPVYQYLIGISNWVSSYWFLLLGAALFVAWMVFTEAGWRHVHRVWLPRVSRSAAKLRGAEVMHLLAIAQQGGRPLAGALSTLARYYYDTRVRGGLLFVRNEIEQGADTWLAMREAGLLTSIEAEALRASPDPAAQSWTLERLAGLRRRHATDRFRLGVALLHPLVMLLLAACMLVIAAGMLGPLIHMINGLS